MLTNSHLEYSFLEKQQASNVCYKEDNLQTATNALDFTRLGLVRANANVSLAEKNLTRVRVSIKFNA